VTWITYGCDCKPFAFKAVNKVVTALTSDCDGGHGMTLRLGFKL